MIALILIVGVRDWLVFSNIDKLAKHLDPPSLAVTEAVSGVLLAALAVQLMLDSLADLGIISIHWTLTDRADIQTTRHHHRG